MFKPTPPLNDEQLASRAAELCWVNILRQLVTMQMQITRDKVHCVGRGKQ